MVNNLSWAGGGDGDAAAAARLGHGLARLRLAGLRRHLRPAPALQRQPRLGLRPRRPVRPAVPQPAALPLHPRQHLLRLLEAVRRQSAQAGDWLRAAPDAGHPESGGGGEAADLRQRVHRRPDRCAAALPELRAGPLGHRRGAPGGRGVLRLARHHVGRAGDPSSPFFLHTC